LIDEREKKRRKKEKQNLKEKKKRCAIPRWGGLFAQARRSAESNPSFHPLRRTKQGCHAVAVENAV